MSNSFPKEIYVIIAGPEDPSIEGFMLGHTDVYALSSPGVIPTARYVLAGVGEVVNETKYTETQEVS